LTFCFQCHLLSVIF
jgi:hypothetical protein